MEKVEQISVPLARIFNLSLKWDKHKKNDLLILLDKPIVRSRLLYTSLEIIS